MGPTTPSPVSARAKKFIQSLVLMAKLVLAVLLISIFAETLPLRPWDPLWYLKFGQISLNYSYIFIIVVFVLLIAEFLGARDMVISNSLPMFITRLLAVGFGIFLLLIPIQMLALGLHWIQSGEQLKNAAGLASKELDTLRGRINGVQNIDQLRQLFGLPKGSAPPLLAGSPNFSIEKARALKSVDDKLFEVQGNLRGARQAQLVPLSINTVKIIIGSSILVFGLFKLRSLRP